MVVIAKILSEIAKNSFTYSFNPAPVSTNKISNLLKEIISFTILENTNVFLFIAY